MSEVWQPAFIALFGVVLAEAFAVLALARSIGVLQLRLGPEPSVLDTRDGLPIGSDGPAVAGLEVATNRLVTLDVKSGRWILVFVSAACHICRDIVRDAGRVSRDGTSNATVVVIARSTHEQNKMFREIAPKTLLISDPLGAVHDAYAVSKAPYAILLHAGRLVAKGVTNTRDQLELLIDEERSTVLGDGHEQWTPIASQEAESD